MPNNSETLEINIPEPNEVVESLDANESMPMNERMEEWARLDDSIIAALSDEPTEKELELGDLERAEAIERRQVGSFKFFYEQTLNKDASLQSHEYYPSLKVTQAAREYYEKYLSMKVQGPSEVDEVNKYWDRVEQKAKFQRERAALDNTALSQDIRLIFGQVALSRMEGNKAGADEMLHQAATDTLEKFTATLSGNDLPESPESIDSLF